MRGNRRQSLTLYSINPTTELEIGRFAEDSPAMVESKIQAATSAFLAWRQTTFAERGRLMHEAAGFIRSNRDRLSLTLVQEGGKPLVQAQREVDRFAGRCEFFGDHAEGFLAPEHVAVSGQESWIRFEPLGVSLGIMPWNFPFGQASRWAVPALMAGNTALLKHASNVTLSALAVQEIFDSAGFPPGVFTTLFLSSERVASVVGDRRIAAVSLTGSTEAGAKVGALAGQALKKVVLELGGSDPLIVLADADVPAAANAAVRGRFGNNSGQACTAAKRFIVVQEVADAFTECLLAETRKLRTGDPLEANTDVGPVAKADVLADLIRLRDATVARGARVAYRAPLADGPGFFFGPTVLDHVTPDMVAAQEETFGPLAVVISVVDAEAAVRVANDSSYGLGASVWTADSEKGSAVAGELQAGMVAINSLVVADPRLPFGGVKGSGFGREMSAHGMRELTNIKTVNIGGPDTPRFSR